MASVINTNTLSMVTQQNLSKSQNDLNTSMERLSSGLRINSAKDDAAGQAIANRMDSQITGLSQAQRNANDGISLAQTAEGALNQVNDNLQRIRELTVQAQNGTNSASDIDSIQQEVNMRIEEINRISDDTDFNGSKILDSAEKFKIQVGANDGEIIEISISDPAFKSRTDATTGATGWKFDPSNEIDNTDTATDSMKVNGESRTVKSLGFDVLTGTVDATGTEAYGDTADKPLATLDAALQSVDKQRSDLGATQNRFDSAITNLATTETNLASAQSRIQDADYAEEVSSMTTAQILQQAGTSMLTQANQVPQNVLSLLG